MPMISRDIKDFLISIEKKVGFTITHPGCGIQLSLDGAKDLIDFVENERRFFMDFFNLSDLQLTEFIEEKGIARCMERTKKGSRCKNSVKGQRGSYFDHDLFREKYGGYCEKHDY